MTQLSFRAQAEPTMHFPSNPHQNSQLTQNTTRVRQWEGAEEAEGGDRGPDKYTEAFTVFPKFGSAALTAANGNVLCLDGAPNKRRQIVSLPRYSVPAADHVTRQCQKRDTVKKSHAGHWLSSWFPQLPFPSRLEFIAGISIARPKPKVNTSGRWERLT